MKSKLNYPVGQVARSITLGLILIGCQIASAQTYTLWVDAARGKDGNPGTASRPLQTLGQAIAFAHAIPGGAVNIKLRPGTYPIAANTIITRDHLAIEGLSNPVLDANGFLDHFATPVYIVPATLGDQSLWLNLLFLVRADDVSVTGLSFNSAAVNTNGQVFLMPIQFEGQWPSPWDPDFQPRALTGGSVRLCDFDNWYEVGGFNYASGSVEQCNVKHCLVGFYVGPSPGGAHVNFSRNHGSFNEEAVIQAVGTPEFWSAPAQPASLSVNISGNLFENNPHIGPMEFFIRDYTPSAMDQPGYLDAYLSGNTFRNNAMADFSLVDLVHDHLFSHSMPKYDTTTAPVTIRLTLAGNSFQGPELTGQITFQSFNDLYDPHGNPLFDYQWIPQNFVQNATVIINDPESELADCVGGTRGFQYRIRQGDNDFLFWNGHSLTGAIPSAGFGVTVPPCP